MCSAMPKRQGTTNNEGSVLLMDKNDGFYVGDSVVVARHTHGWTGRVMALAEGYAMVRYPRCAPFVVPVKELTRVSDG